MNVEQAAQRAIVLVVDDSAETVAMLADALETNGMSALVALRGDRAVAIAKQITPDAIVLDAVMPGMDGFETCRQIKQDAGLADAPVIFMTGLSDADHVVRGFQAGGVDYVTKPIDPRALIARIRAHVANARQAVGARSALDSAGRFLLSADKSGRLVWWTPQAGRLIARFLGGPVQAGAELPPPVRNLLAAADISGPERVVRLADGVTALEIGLISRDVQGECLMRIVEQRAGAPASVLKTHLPVSDREAEVLNWIAQGKSNRDIADILEMSPRTVNKHLERIFRKIGVENRTAAALMATKFLKDPPPRS
jgi:DNA-binding NarL/FixJ family response regulator